MKKNTFQGLIKKGFLTTAFLAFAILGFSQKKQEVTDSLSVMLSKEFGRTFTLDPNMSLGCQNSAKESYYGPVIPPVKGQAHYHARLKMEGDQVLDILRITTAVRDIKELVQREDAYAYLNDISASRFWVEEVKVENTYYLVVGLD
jgi:hypothetical protein